METGLSTRRRPAPPATRVLALSGHADLDTAPALAEALQDALTAPPAPDTLVIDCHDLVFCSSSGLNELLKARRAAIAAGTAFGLAAPSPQVTRLLRVTETDTVFDIAPIAPSPAVRDPDPLF
ncbi:STAS domain-containing protein [Kitasatospora sp. A2-31]|uniref:STAS domain-containing protein n=1 Tax=Kitasatospora sp. A2-31 TaxID=2916414 RepID=UPI001EECBD28|nr:STAS domain-containing protein [Kitasatospora sp. A2-31]MCG6494309.1 STAS domain-containing protein [Kitasatospora sp. A2-31]